MTDPWAELAAAPGKGQLFLDQTVKTDVENAFGPYNDKLTELKRDALDDTNGYFGTDDNPLASHLEAAFNGRGKVLTDYLKEQQAQALNLVTAAQEAAKAQHAADNP